jgi:hypothetical protein
MSAVAVAWLYTLRGIKSYSPTRLPHCIALGWHETPLYDNAVDYTNHHNALKCPYCNPSKLDYEHAKAVGWNEAIKCAAEIVRGDKALYEAISALDKSMEAIND